MSCNSFNVVYVVLCFGCLEEYTGEISVGKTKLRKPDYTQNMNDNPNINLKPESTYEFLKEVLSKYIHLLV